MVCFWVPAGASWMKNFGKMPDLLVLKQALRLRVRREVFLSNGLPCSSQFAVSRVTNDSVSGYFFRISILAQPYKLRMPQDAASCPLRKFDFSNNLGLRPNIISRF